MNSATSVFTVVSCLHKKANTWEIGFLFSSSRMKSVSLRKKLSLDCWPENTVINRVRNHRRHQDFLRGGGLKGRESSSAKGASNLGGPWTCFPGVGAHSVKFGG